MRLQVDKTRYFPRNRRIYYPYEYSFYRRVPYLYRSATVQRARNLSLHHDRRRKQKRDALFVLACNLRRVDGAYARMGRQRRGARYVPYAQTRGKEIIPYR